MGRRFRTSAQQLLEVPSRTKSARAQKERNKRSERSKAIPLGPEEDSRTSSGGYKAQVSIRSCNGHLFPTARELDELSLAPSTSEVEKQAHSCLPGAMPSSLPQSLLCGVLILSLKAPANNK